MSATVESLTLDFTPDEQKLLQAAVKSLAGIESSRLPAEFSPERLASIKALQARVTPTGP